MLSSLAEQVRHCDYTLGVSVACLEGPTLDVVNLFAGHGLNVKPLVYKDLATLQPRPLTIGLGFASAFLPDFEPEPHDMPLDAILNDNGVVWPV